MRLPHPAEGEGFGRRRGCHPPSPAGRRAPATEAGEGSATVRRGDGDDGSGDRVGPRPPPPVPHSSAWPGTRTS